MHIIEDGTGYPSGHSMTAAMISLLLVLLVFRFNLKTWIRTVASVGAAAILVLVGWIRIWAGAHWPSDVLGGWLYGIALMHISWLVATRFAVTEDTAR